MRSQFINRVTSGALAAVLLLTNVLLPAQPAFAGTGGGSDDHKYTICHRGDAVTNPYQSTPVDYHSIVNESGHDDHNGIVATTQVVAQELKDNHQKWGDIIPAIPAEDGHAAYPGQNLTAEGLAILANDCEVPSGVVDMPQPPVVDKCNPLATPAISNVAWGEYADTDEYHWTLESDGSLTATAEYGYHFELKNGDYVDSVNFTLPTDDGRLCDAEQVTVPTELVTDELCGKNNPNYLTDSLDAVEHVTYVVNADRSVTVTADMGYTLNINGAVVGSTYTYVAPAEILCDATSEEPEFVDNCGVLNDYYIVKDTDHIAYYSGETKLVAGEKNYVTDASKVSVSAQVTDENYVLVGDAPYEFQFTDERCAPSVELDVKAKCKGTDTKIIANVENTTDSEQAYLVMVRDASGVLKKRVVVVAAHDSTRTAFKVNGDGSFTVKVFAYDQATHSRGDLLVKMPVNPECTVVDEDTFTPEIYKMNQDGQILSTGTFDIKVCQPRPALIQSEDPNGCTTYEDVTLGTDGMWFANNVVYTENVPTTVTITETKAPVGCTAATMPWVFNWNYNYENYRILSSNYMPNGSWDTADGSNVFNLTNQCEEGGKGGSGGETPIPTPKPTHKPAVTKTVTPSETLANTGTSTNGILAIAVAMLLASIGFAVSPRFGRTDA